MSLINPALVPPRTTSLHHTFLNNTTTTMIRSYDSGEWQVQAHVLHKSQSVTGLRQRPELVTRLSRMGSFDDIARHVGMWGQRDTVAAIAEHGLFDTEGEEEWEDEEALGRPSRDKESVALIPPPVPRKSSKREKVPRRRGVSSFTKLIERHCVKEEPKYDIFDKHMQSERTYSKNKELGFQYTTPGLKEAAVIHTVLDEDQQEAIRRFKALPSPPADFGLDGQAAEQVRRAHPQLKAKVNIGQPIPRDFAKTAGATQSAKGDVSGTPSTDQNQPRSCFEQGKDRKLKLHTAALLAKVKSVRRRQAQEAKPDQSQSSCRLKSKALTLKLKQSLSIHRQASAKPTDGPRAEGEVDGQAQAPAKSKALLEFESERQILLHEIHIARKTKHQRWLQAESEMARAQNRPPNPIPPILPLTLHGNLENEAKIHAIALDAAFDSTPSSRWRSSPTITKITTLTRSGNIRIISPPNHGILCLCRPWLDHNDYLRDKAMEHMHQIEVGNLPSDHLLSGCDCYLYRVHEAFTNNDITYIGIAQTQKETLKEGKGRWVIYLAKEAPISKLLHEDSMPPTNFRRVPERRPTSANRPRPRSVNLVKMAKRHSKRIVFFPQGGLRDVGAI